MYTAQEETSAAPAQKHASPARCPPALQECTVPAHGQAEIATANADLEKVSMPVVTPASSQRCRLCVVT